MPRAATCCATPRRRPAGSTWWPSTGTGSSGWWRPSMPPEATFVRFTGRSQERKDIGRDGVAVDDRDARDSPPRGMSYDDEHAGTTHSAAFLRQRRPEEP